MPEVIGFTAGLFDLFHVGDLDLLRRARRQCDRLVVGIGTDELAAATRGAGPYVPLIERAEILGHVRYVDDVLPLESWAAPGRFDVIFTYPGAPIDLSGVRTRVVRLPDLARTGSPVLRAALVNDRIRSSVA